MNRFNFQKQLRPTQIRILLNDELFQKLMSIAEHEGSTLPIAGRALLEVGMEEYFKETKEK